MGLIVAAIFGAAFGALLFTEIPLAALLLVLGVLVSVVW